jgi:D-alanyl-D-alanine carboxypeptidase/D-alanyl-D-alanine-endopeptidase (penicillin-binding protein 4)
MPTAAGLSTTITPLLTGVGGGKLSVSVADVVTGQELYATAGSMALVPASTTKVITGVTALAALGPAHRLSTRVVVGANPGEIVLVGGGDPTLAPGANGTYPAAARLDELATAVRAALGTTTPAKVVYDSSLFAGPDYAVGWDATIAEEGYGAPIRALTIDGARTVPNADPHASYQPPRHTQPDLVAARAFAKALGLSPNAVVAGTAPAGARELARVESPPMARLVELMMLDSDNVLAEALARQVAIARQQPATFEGAATAMRTVLTELGVMTDGFGLVDGSGLSKNGRLSATLLTSVLSIAARSDRPQLHAVFAGLPVAGYSGTLSTRYQKPTNGGPAAGYVRAKTGTLGADGIHSLAGIVVDGDGRTLAFAVLANSVTKSETSAREGMDRLAAALASCGCR